jgi:hypothetical protein
VLEEVTNDWEALPKPVPVENGTLCASVHGVMSGANDWAVLVDNPIPVSPIAEFEGVEYSGVL